MKRILLWSIGAILVLLVIIQAVPFGHGRTNPPVTAEPDWDSPETRELFFRACGDCHSNETRWPWYSAVAPVSWLIQDDVAEGREHFNVSEWGRPENEGDEAAEEFEEGEMPLRIYLPLHPEARLDDQERAALLEGLIATFGTENDEGHGERGEGDDDH